MPMIRNKLRLCAGTCLVFLMTACGGGSGSGSPPTTDTKTSAPLASATPVAENASQASALDVLGAAQREKVLTAAGTWIPARTKPIRTATEMPPIPADTWQAPMGSTPDSGSFLYLESDSVASLFTGSESPFTLTADGPDLAILAGSSPAWQGHFRALRGQKQWTSGFYADLGQYPLSTPTKGSVNWGNSERTCHQALGWVTIDSIGYTAGRLSAIELRFEQRCEGQLWPIRGKLRWSDPSLVPVPPVPSDLWQPPAGSTPASGNYIYLESDANDYIGQGRRYTYTQRDAILTVTAETGLISARVDGNEWWFGDFKAMAGVDPMQVGHYARVQRYPFHDAARGGLSWSGDGRGCNTLTGWFAVDSISFVDGVLQAVDLRFEQHCEGWSQALRGKIHWRKDDTTAPLGPLTPPPADLWTPATGATPAAGSFVYLESEAGDYIGGGVNRLYTPAMANLQANWDGRSAQINARSGNVWWNGSFAPMNTLPRLQPGYYGDASRYPFHNPTRGGMSWTGEGRGCNKSSGWFVVDNISYEGSLLTVIDVRFEQRCDGAAGVLRGRVRWTLD